MATWVRSNTNRIAVNGVNLTGTLNLDNGTAPGDFDPAGVTSVLVSIQVDGTAAGEANDQFTMSTAEGWSLSTPGGTAAASGYDTGTVTNLLMTASNTASGTDSSPSTGLTTGNWESATVVAGGTNVAYATYVQNMKGDNAELDIDIGDATVTITYTPSSTDRTAQVAWAEFETPLAPRAAQVSFAEFETPLAPRAAQVAWAELETPNAPSVTEHDHAYVSDDTEATTTSSTFQTALTLSSTNLAANTKYLLLARAFVGHDSSASSMEVRVSTADDSNIATKSLHSMEPQNITATDKHHYFWPHSFTTDATPADILLEFRSVDNTTTARIDQRSLFVLNLDDIGTPGTDYFESIQAVDGATELSTTDQTTILAEIAGSDMGTLEHLIIGYARVDHGTAGNWSKIQAYAAMDASTQSLQFQEQRDSEQATEQHVVGFMLRHKASSGTPNATVYGSEEVATADHTDGGAYMIALPTSIFEDFTYAFTSGGVLVNSGTTTSVQNLTSYSPTTADANHILWGHFNRQAGPGKSHGHLERGGTDTRPGDDAHTFNLNWTGSLNTQSAKLFERLSIPSAAATIDLNARSDVSNQTYENRLLMAISLEKVTAPRTVQVSWAELETPLAPRTAQVSFAELEVPTAPRTVQVSWAELETPLAPRTVQVSFAELETPSAPRTAQVSWAELEVPTAPRTAQVAWAEFEVPTAPRTAQVSWAELEVPLAPRTAQVSWAELETPSAPRTVQVAWAEFETPNVPPRKVQVAWAELEVPLASRTAQVSWAELEVPTAPRTVQVSFAEVEVPLAPRTAQVSWAELETPSAPRTVQIAWAEFETPLAPRTVQVAWAEFEIPTAPRTVQVAWAEMEVPLAPRAVQVAWAELETPSTTRTAQVAWAEFEVPSAPRSAQVAWAELEAPSAPRTVQVSFAEMEVPTAPRTVQVSWAELETPLAPRTVQVSWAELETPNAPAAPRTVQVSFAELEVPTAPRTVQIAWTEFEVPTAPRTVQVSFAELEAPLAPRTAQVSWAELETPDVPRRVQVAWAELETPLGARTAQIAWAELEVPTAPRTARVAWAELETPNAFGFDRVVRITWAAFEVPERTAVAPGWYEQPELVENLGSVDFEAPIDDSHKDADPPAWLTAIVDSITEIQANLPASAPDPSVSGDDPVSL